MNGFTCHGCGENIDEDDTVWVNERAFCVPCAPDEDEEKKSGPAFHPNCPECVLEAALFNE